MEFGKFLYDFSQNLLLVQAHPRDAHLASGSASFTPLYEKLQKDLIEAARVSEVFKKEVHSKDKEDQKASHDAEIKNLRARNSELAKNLETATEGLKTLQGNLRESEDQKRAIQKEKEDAVGKLQDLEGKILQCNKDKEHLQKTVEIVHDGVDIIPEFDDFDDTDPQDILSDAEADADERDQEDVELAGPVDAEHRRDTPADQDAPSTSRRAGKRGLGKNNNDSQAKKIREEKEEKERKMDQEKNERKRRSEERAGTSGSSYQFSRRRRTVGLCDGVEEPEAAGGPSQDKNPRSRSEERLLVEDDQDFDIEAHFEEDAEEEPHVVQPGRRGRKPNKTLEQRKQQTAPAIEAKRRRIEEKKKKKRKEDELKKMLEEARNYSGSPELTD